MIVSRRTLLGASAALLAVPARGQEPLPEVDRLSVRILVDSNVSAFAQPVNRTNLVVERAPRAAVDVRSHVLGEWGLSLLIESRRGDERRVVLMDFGYSPEILLNNAQLIGADFAEVDAMLLSHGHYDHFGGMAGLLATGKVRRGTALIVGGEGALCHRLRGDPANKFDFGMVDQSAIRAAGIELQVRANPALLAGHGLTTGRIPLKFEQPSTPSWMEPGKGCALERLDPDQQVPLFQDDSRHELGLAYNVKGRGLVVLGSCSHRGILNTIAAAQAATGVNRIHAVMGGFHLVYPQTDADALRAAKGLAALSPDVVVPAHCSGETFIAAAEVAMPGRVIRPYVGSRFQFRT